MEGGRGGGEAGVAATAQGGGLGKGGGRREGREGRVGAVARLSSGGGGGSGGLLSLRSDGEPAANQNTEIIMQFINNVMIDISSRRSPFLGSANTLDDTDETFKALVCLLAFSK